MQMSNYQLFRTRMKNEAECLQKMETSFITSGAAPIVIHIPRLDKNRDATMVFTDTEGPDTAIVFTPKQQNAISNLLKTDYYTWDDKMFFVYEDVIITREVNYIKQKAYQCNAQVYVIDTDEECGGYFISSLRSYVDVEFQQKLNVSDKEKPVLVVPRQEWVKYGARVMIGEKPWKVIDYDAITNPGIAYVSLERDFISKSSDVVEYHHRDELKPGIEYSFATEQGFFNSSSPLTIKSRTEKMVVFEIPYGIKEVEIGVKHKDEIVTNKYKVVM